MYYLQSRYYDPSIGRFLNADAFASTGQGILGNNMFAYCGNNPVTRTDKHGDSWVVIGTGLVVAGVTGLSNGYSSYIAGGQFWPAFGIGIGAGGIGFAISMATKSPAGLLSIRALTSLGSNLLTTSANSGLVTVRDFFVSAWDATMDSVFSAMMYYYNPFGGFLASNMFNAIADGITDIAESWLFSSPNQNNTTQNDTSANSGISIKSPYSYIAYAG